MVLRDLQDVVDPGEEGAVLGVTEAAGVGAILEVVEEGVISEVVTEVVQEGEENSPVTTEGRGEGVYEEMRVDQFEEVSGVVIEALLEKGEVSGVVTEIHLEAGEISGEVIKVHLEEGTDSEQEGIGNPDTVEIQNEGSLMDSEDSVVKPKTPKKANKKKPAKEKQERVRLPYIQLLPGQAKKAVQFSNLPSLFNEFNDELKKFAETVGPVELLTYNRFPHPKGCYITALCVYEDKEHVAKAIEKLHGREFRGNHLLVERPSPKNSIRLDKKSVCVSNLSEKTTEEDLWKYFKECGSIRTIEIRRDCSSLVPENLGLARIYFNDSDSLDRAVALSNSQLLGSTIKVFSLSCDLVVYVKNFALQTKYKTIKDFMTAVNAVYYCFVYLKSRHMKEKLKGLLFYFPDQESYHNVVSMENFQEIPAKMQKLMGCSGSLSFGTKQIFKGEAGNNQKVAVKEEHSDKNESDSADEKEEVVQDAKKKSKKNKKLSKALSNVQNESDASDKTIEVVQNPQKKLKKNKKPTKAPSNGAAKELKAFRKRKGSEVSNTSPIKKNRIVVKAEN